jgi:hypothetical protein
MPNSTTNPPVEIAVPAWTASGPTPVIPLTVASPTATTLLLTRIFVNGSVAASGVNLLNGTGTTATPNSVRAFLFDASGSLVAASTATGATGLATAYASYTIPFSAPYSVSGPTTLYIGIMTGLANSLSTYSLNSKGALPSLATGSVNSLVYATYGLDSAGALSKTTSLTATQIPVAYTDVVGPVASLY